MTQFYPAASRDSSYTRDELLAVARSGYPLRSIGYGYATAWETPAPQHGFSFRWVNRQGMGNHGQLVLAVDRDAAPALRSMASAALRMGRVERIVEVTGCQRASAERLDTVSRGIPYAHEAGVLRAALALAKLPPGTLDDAPACGGGLGRWIDGLPWQTRTATVGLSCPRIASAIAIARKLLD